MAKHYVLSLVALVSAFGSQAQLLPVDGAEYDTWKLSQAPPAGEVIFLGDTELLPPDGVRDACDCWVEPDGTYTTINNNTQWNAMGYNNADDGSRGPIALPFPFHLYGQNYFNAYINTNGNITFNQYYTAFSPAGFPLPGYAMVAPFWADVDLRGPGAGNNIVRYKVTPTAMYVNWINVGYYNQQVDKRNTFQVIISNGSDPAVPHGANVSFCYKDMQWTTGSFSGGVNGFGGTPATVGANRGTGGQYMQFGRFNQNNSNYDGPFGANDGVHWLDYKHFLFATDISSANVPPVATSETVCDSMVLCVGELADLDVVFLSPEPNQITTVTVNAPTLTGLNIITNTPGVNATVESQVLPTPADVGEHIVTFIATDNGSPVMTTTFEVLVIVQPGGLLDPGAMALCDSDGPTALLPALPGVPAGGTWTSPTGGAHTGSFDPSTDPDGDYEYTVVASGSTCASTGTVSVTVEPAADAGTSGVVTLCSDGGVIDLGDHLGGTPDATGVWLNSSGTPVGSTFDPSTQPGGTYDYVVSGGVVCPDDVASVIVTVNPAPDAGGSAALGLCEDAAPFALLSGLSGTPAANGTWSGPATIPGGVFNPAVHPGGTYTYTVNGVAPCANASATLSIDLDEVPWAGTNGSSTHCAIGPQTALFPALGGSPESGGTWQTPSGAPHSGTLDPATDVSGVYVYTVAGQGNCSHLSATALVTVSIVPEGSAGDNATVSVCAVGGNLVMTSALGGAPPLNGTWTGPSNTNGVFVPGTHQPGVYTYSVPGVPPCPAQSATLTITIDPGPSAGNDASINVCENGPGTVLFPLLGGGAQANGTWYDPQGGTFNGTLDPSTAQSGEYQYVVNGQQACAGINDVAVVTVGIQALPNAGQNNAINVCEVGGGLVMIGALNGTPAANGSWSGPSSTGGTFLPGSHLAGVYTYTVPGVAPCPAQSATLTIGVDPAPWAGTDATATYCENGSTTNLFNLLGGSPNTGGTWSDPFGIPYTGNFNPATTPPGTHQYLVLGQLYCVGFSDMATVIVTVQELPDPGQNSSVSLCPDADPLIMTGSLYGTPAENGTWSGPSVTNGIFLAGNHTPGVYTYTVPGIAPCPAQSATLTIGMDPLPSAGADAQVTLCTNGAPMNLFPQLGASANSGGQWLNPLGGTFNGIMNPASGQSGIYLYVVQGTGACDHLTDTAAVQIQVNTLPDPGQPASVSLCMDAGPLSMIGSLLGSPAQNGTWSGPSGVSSGTFQPGQDQPGIYTYTVPGVAPCPSQSTTLTLAVVPLPVAGGDGSLVSCENAAPSEMIGALQEPFNANGTWFTPNGQSYNGWMDPLSHSPGAHLYVVQGIGPCAHASDTAVVMVTINPMPTISFAVEPAQGCHPLEVTLHNTTPTELVQSAQWVFGDGSAMAAGISDTHLYQHPGSFTVTLQVSTVDGCLAVLQVPASVVVDRAPEADFTFGPSPATYTNHTVFFTATDPNAAHHTWTMDGVPIGDKKDTQFTFPRTMTGAYEVCLHVEDVHGCMDDACQRVNVVIPNISVPTAFTPDGDALNEIFLPILTDIDPAHYSLEIFDRWGRLVFNTTDPDQGWDGRYQATGDVLTTGVYLWQMSALPIGTADKVAHSGTVTLVK